MTRGVFTRFVSLMIYIGIWQDLFEYRIGNPITINLARFFTLLSNFTQLRVEYLSNGSKEKEKVEEEGGGGEREKQKKKIQLRHFVRAAIRIIINKRRYEITLHETRLKTEQQRPPTFPRIDSNNPARSAAKLARGEVKKTRVT